MAAAAALLRAASGDESELRGTVRLTASEFIGGAVLPPMLARFHAGHPTVDIELSLSDRTEDLLRRDADLAVRNVMPTQSALVTRRIGGAPICLFAHRDYAAVHGLPATAGELALHTLIGRDEHTRQVRPTLRLDLQFWLPLRQRSRSAGSAASRAWRRLLPGGSRTTEPRAGGRAARPRAGAGRNLAGHA
jgi:DNA-binding transcriptional LysR family regulator